MAYRIAIFGASGYAGGELARLVARHPDLDLAYLAGHGSAGETLGTVHPHLAGGERVLQPMDPEAVADVDLAFLALPHGASAAPAVRLRELGVAVVDLGSDFRLSSPERYEEAYGDVHRCPEQLGRWVYGLPELFGDRIAGSQQVAAAGCYPTSVVLAVAPLLSAGLIGPDVIADSLSGVTGAGRAAKPELTFGAVDEGVAAYAVLTHRHRPEMEQVLTSATGVPTSVVFTPHLVPMQRGILSTCYATTPADIAEADVVACLEKAYAAAPFVDVVPDPPKTRWVVGSNRCLISAHVDPGRRTVVLLSAIDNLIKGAAGQAVQCANLMLGLPEEAGLPVDGWLP